MSRNIRLLWSAYPRPRNKAELAYQLELFFGLRFPSVPVCPGHTAPLDALAEAYFAEYPVIIWIASRGFGGKTTMLAGLSLMELLHRYDVVLLGGSGEQSARAHRVTARAWSHSAPARRCRACRRLAVPSDVVCAWCTCTDFETVGIQGAPRNVLAGEPLATKTRTVWGNEMVALTASTRSTRGPHPQRLRMDEADEMDLEIVDAAMGQTMTTDPDRPPQTVLASTHHYATGTMTELLKRAAEHGWAVRRWCFRETLLSPTNPGSWLLPENVDRKRTEVTSAMWRVEYDLEPPDEGGALFPKRLVDALFEAGVMIDDKLNTPLELEPPAPEGDYVTAADWARKSDLSVIATVRFDCEPARVVGWARFFRQPWPKVIDYFNRQVKRYGGWAVHDATGIGDVVDAYLTVAAKAFVMTGIHRTQLFLDYEKAVESGMLRLPPLRSLIDVHSTVQRDDLYGTGHPPDEIVALALAVSEFGDTVSRRTARKRGRVGRVRTF